MSVVCKLHLVARCKRESRCEFSHKVDRANPPLCEFFNASGCKFGSKCGFKHQRAVSESQLETKPRKELCHYHQKGRCTQRKHCQYAHGKMCKYCKKIVLHPDDGPEEHDKHMDQCRVKMERRRMLYEGSKDKECMICHELVIDKLGSNAKFGLMECKHWFCIGCIRDWRKSKEMALAKCCPMCRQHSNLLVPSNVWPIDDSHKQEIIAGYKLRLSRIDCKHFNFGNGNCPFAQDCFYRHTTIEDESILIVDLV